MNWFIGDMSILRQGQTRLQNQINSDTTCRLEARQAHCTDRRQMRARDSSLEKPPSTLLTLTDREHTYRRARESTLICDLLGRMNYMYTLPGFEVLRDHELSVANDATLPMDRMDVLKTKHAKSLLLR